MTFNPLPILVTAVGGYMLIRLRLYPFSRPLQSLARAIRALREPRTFRSFTLALAGTLGVGNVFGVCVGIAVGGAGSVFWLLLSVLPSSVLKYSEVVLASDNLSTERDGRHGGMSYVLASVARGRGRLASRLYAVAALLLSLFMGAALQSATVVESSVELFDTPPLVTSVIFTALVLFGVAFGTSVIERITSIIMPVTTIVYIILTLSVIIHFRSELPRVFADILDGAFTGEGVLGGAVATLTSAPLREGFCRGILSNEAGAGTSSMAHSRGAGLSPATSGLLGILEVVFDTLVLCTLTALAVLSAIPEPSLIGSPMALILDAVGGTLGDGAGILLFASVLVFAYATVICWYYYGRESLSFLFGDRLCGVYFLFYLGFSVMGFALGERLLISATDLLLLVLTLLTSLAIIKGSDRIVSLSEPQRSSFLKIKESVSQRAIRSRGQRGCDEHRPRG